jgi:DNA repair protein RadC
MGPVRSARLQAACELGRRLTAGTVAPGLRIRGPEDLADLLDRELGGLDREHFLGIYLDARHRLRAVRTVSVGTLDASLVHPREVYRPAVGLQAAAVIVAHNHPSGSARPSGDDLELTRRLARGGRLLGIELLDHLVVGDGELVSIREYGWPDPP